MLKSFLINKNDIIFDFNDEPRCTKTVFWRHSAPFSIFMYTSMTSA